MGIISQGFFFSFPNTYNVADDLSRVGSAPQVWCECEKVKVVGGLYALSPVPSVSVVAGHPPPSPVRRLSRKFCRTRSLDPRVSDLIDAVGSLGSWF